MRVLVTGGAGFIGSHVVDMLLASGHLVTVLDNLTTGSQANLTAEVRLFQADVRSETLLDIFRQARPDVVVHLAAQVSVAASVADPSLDLSVNVVGTANVLESAASAGVRKVISISSAAVYGLPTQLPLTESSATAAISPYGLSKLMGEQYVRMLGGLRGMPNTIIRPSNVYGPRQTTQGEGAVLPAFLNRFLTKQDATIHGTGLQTRDFLYVTDLARAILLALDRADGMTLNISSGIATSVNELWRMLASLTGWNREPLYGPCRTGDIDNSVMDNQAASSHLGWKPGVPLMEGLACTIKWACTHETAVAEESKAVVGEIEPGVPRPSLRR